MCCVVAVILVKAIKQMDKESFKTPLRNKQLLTKPQEKQTEKRGKLPTWYQSFCGSIWFFLKPKCMHTPFENIIAKVCLLDNLYILHAQCPHLSLSFHCDIDLSS